MNTISSDDDKCNQKVLSARDLIETPAYATIPVSHCAIPSNLQPIDLVILGTIISVAKMLADELNKEQARKRGREYRERELQNYDEFGAQWKARREGTFHEDFGHGVPTILHTFENKDRIKPFPVGVSVRRAMSKGYKDALRDARRNRATSITVRTSPYLLLAAARLVQQY
jgi:hypothetical protein